MIDQPTSGELALEKHSILFTRKSKAREWLAVKRCLETAAGTCIKLVEYVP